MLAREVRQEIQSTGKAEEEFQKALTAFTEKYRNERIEKVIEAFRYDEEVNLKQLSQRMIQYWKKTGGLLEEGEQLNIPNEESSDEEEETSKQKDYLEIGSSTFKGKDAETGDLFEPKKKIYRKSTSGPSETLMIHEESENPEVLFL